MLLHTPIYGKLIMKLNVLTNYLVEILLKCSQDKINKGTKLNVERGAETLSQFPRP